jgi:hypothetical protein
VEKPPFVDNVPKGKPLVFHIVSYLYPTVNPISSDFVASTSRAL